MINPLLVVKEDHLRVYHDMTTTSFRNMEISDVVSDERQVNIGNLITSAVRRTMRKHAPN